MIWASRPIRSLTASANSQGGHDDGCGKPHRVQRHRPYPAIREDPCDPRRRRAGGQPHQPAHRRRRGQQRPHLGDKLRGITEPGRPASGGQLRRTERHSVPDGERGDEDEGQPAAHSTAQENDRGPRLGGPVPEPSVPPAQNADGSDGRQRQGGSCAPAASSPDGTGRTGVRRGCGDGAIACRTEVLSACVRVISLVRVTAGLMTRERPVRVRQPRETGTAAMPSPRSGPTEPHRDTPCRWLIGPPTHASSEPGQEYGVVYSVRRERLGS